MNFKCTLAYAGTHYFGWQKTQTGPSIEETLEKALEQLLRHPVSLQAASRTDRGVHARRQVINFLSQERVDLIKLERGLQGLLPKDISIYSLEIAPDHFHPTLDCKSKEYEYLICNSSIQLPFHREFSWHYRYPLDIDLMQQACQHFLGTHDFSSFSNERILSPDSAVRTIENISITQIAPERLCISIRGNAFLYKMVRNIVGTLVYVGAKKISLEHLPRILEAKDRTLAGITAPAHGLCLSQVIY